MVTNIQAILDFHSLKSSTCREWRTFKNSARSDNLALGHWVKANSDPNEGTVPCVYTNLAYILHVIPLGYPFVKYNVQATKYTYSQDEYNRLLEGKSQLETNGLFLIR
jgi:hypothetical protein